MERRLAAILAADVVGYSRLMSANEAATLTALKAHQTELIEGKIAEHKGRIVKLAGDGILAEFPSVVGAVACAADIQRGMRHRNENVPEERRIEFRVGVNLGDVIVEGDDIFGDGVNLAARLEGIAEPGGIAVSGSVRDHIGNRLDLHFEDLGERPLKNMEGAVRIYAVVDRESFTAPTPVAAEPDKPSIAVLPFRNVSGDPEQEYFSDGITEDIITALSRLRWFLVIARNSSFAYKGRAIDVKQVGRELGVRYVLEGSVRRSGNRIRITTQLVDALTGTHYWAESYDRELTDIFGVQDEITRSVSSAIEPKLVAAEATRSQKRRGGDLDAWDLVMRALTHYWRMTNEHSETAIEMLRRAVTLHPEYGPAHSMLAFALLVSGHVGWLPAGHDYAHAAHLARRAAELDDEDPWAHLALGYYAFTQRDTAEAVREYHRALDLNPNFATAYGYLGWALAFDGQAEEAIQHFQRALRMSPYDPLKAFFYSGTGVGHYYLRKYDEAIDWIRNAIRQRPGFTAAHRILVASLAQAGRSREAEAAMARLRELQPSISIDWIEHHVPYTLRAMPHFLEGMRKAGLR